MKLILLVVAAFVACQMTQQSVALSATAIQQRGELSPEWVEPVYVEVEARLANSTKPAGKTPPKAAGAKPACAQIEIPADKRPKEIKIEQDLIGKAAKQYTWTSNPKKRGVCDDPKHVLQPATVRAFLLASWKAFGATDAQATNWTTLNQKQIMRESSNCPNILQGIIGDVNDNNPAGGLFQFITGTFNTWMVKGHDNRFNPLSNILAAVNAQVNAACITKTKRILDGSSGWGPQGGTNPYK